MDDQCLQQNVQCNPLGGVDIQSFCTRNPRHVRRAQLAITNADFFGEDFGERSYDHYDKRTGRWWDLDGADRTHAHDPLEVGY